MDPTDLDGWYTALKTQVPADAPCDIREVRHGDVRYLILDIQGPKGMKGFITAGNVPEDSRPVGPNTMAPGPYLGYYGIESSPIRSMFTPVTPEKLQEALRAVLAGFVNWGQNLP